MAQSLMDVTLEQQHGNKRLADIRDSQAKRLDMNEDFSDVMLGSSVTARLRGVIEEPGWHYHIVTENMAVNGKSRPNFAKRMGQGYEIAKLPDGTEANWPDVCVAILRIPEEKWQKYRRMIEVQTLKNSGALADDNSVTQEEVEDGMVMTRRRKTKRVSAADMGITVPGDE